VFAALATLTACGDGAGRRDPGDVAGTWALVADSAGAVFLRVSADEVEVYAEAPVADCFEHELYRVLEIEGTRFRLTNDADTFAVDLRREGDELIVDAFGEPEAYASTDVDPTTLPVCTRTSPGAVCAEQEAIGIGEELERTLTGSDATNVDGSHYDLYRLDVAAADSVAIDMSSTEIDAVLVLFDSAGTFVAENDDASSLTLDARLAPALDAGCWLIMATSSGADEFGAYAIGISNP
jgi:hypothetical protein